jgi:hypothetical protein
MKCRVSKTDHFLFFLYPTKSISCLFETVYNDKAEFIGGNRGLIHSILSYSCQNKPETTFKLLILLQKSIHCRC